MWFRYFYLWPSLRRYIHRRLLSFNVFAILSEFSLKFEVRQLQNRIGSLKTYVAPWTYVWAPSTVANVLSSQTFKMLCQIKFPTQNSHHTDIKAIPPSVLLRCVFTSTRGSDKTVVLWIPLYFNLWPRWPHYSDLWLFQATVYFAVRQQIKQQIYTFCFKNHIPLLHLQNI